MIKKQYAILVAVMLLTVAGCNTETIERDSELITTEQGQKVSASALVQGEMRVKVTPSFAETLTDNTDSDGVVITTKVDELSVSLKSLNIIKVERTFPYAGKFEARTRAEGLHLWYDIYFDSSVPLTKADEKLSSMDGITYVEYRPKTVPLFTEDYQELLPSEQFSTEQTATSLPFNDPQLSDQWHYYNDGSYSGSVAGCDVNIVPVWEKYTTGSPDVIVSIVDGGIDYHHEDLAGNMWNNPEQSGSYVYGYNFINGGYAITADNHGTHVAGTISAVNNNGTGVCGIAGGNSKKSIPGVKLMSCQIFDNTDRTGDGSRAIKWGADHGAVISQNSWGYDGGTYTPASDKAAIDYFNKYAGMDENGNQTGPMEGGIVIFAAGNDGKSVGYPGEYEGCLAVAAVGSNYVKARFSNYGSWVDIAAPGVGILSTVPNNSYGKMNGTSMACPHVSGVAALLVSYFKGIGFTRESLWNKLTLSATDIQKYNSGNSEIGGLVNAYTAIASSSTTAPDPVTYLNAAVKSNIVTVSMVVPKDKDDKKAYGISVFFSTSAISSANCDCKNFSVGDLNVGDTLTGIITGLDFESMYYLSACAYDMSGNRSALSKNINITTGSNTSPTITALNGTELTMKAYQTIALNFKIEDADGHSFTVKISDDSGASELVMTSTSNAQITITGTKAPAGSYTATLNVTDDYGAYADLDIHYTIEKNNPPEIIKSIDNQVFGAKNVERTFNIGDYFTDLDGEPLSFILECSDNAVVNLNVANNLIYITSLKYGTAECTITAKDALDESVSTSFKVLVRDETVDIDLYPNPVKTTLFLRTSQEQTATVRVTNMAGGEIFNKSVSISPFNPGSVDMSNCSGGTYNVSIETGSKTITKTVVKL